MASQLAPRYPTPHSGAGGPLARQLTHRMCLARLALQAMLLLPILRMVMLRLPRVRLVITNILLIILDRLPIHLIQHLQTQFNIRQELITPTLAEILSHYYSQHFEVFSMRSHGICRNNPRALAQNVSKCEFIVVLVCLGVQAERHEGETLAVALGHDDEAELLEGVGEVVCCASKVGHDGAVAMLAEADELVVLADDLGGSFGEVEREGGLVCAEVVDVEDEFFGEVFRASPNDPAYAWVDEAVSVLVLEMERVERGGDVLVARNVDGNHLLESEIPFEVRDHERSNESTRSSINMNNRINLLLNQQIIDSLRILIFTRVSRAQNNTNTNRILIHELDRLLGINNISVRCAEHVFLLDLEVACSFLPADLHSRAHDDVGLVKRLVSSLAGILPAFLHGENSEHDGFRGADSGGAYCGCSFFSGGGIKEAADHGDAAVLDVGGLGVFFVVDEVLGEGLAHQIFDFFLLRT
jgi:hypothetical protein